MRAVTPRDGARRPQVRVRRHGPNLTNGAEPLSYQCEIFAFETSGADNGEKYARKVHDRDRSRLRNSATDEQIRAIVDTAEPVMKTPSCTRCVGTEIKGHVGDDRVVVWCAASKDSGTNLGSRLGLLTAITGRWVMVIMSAIWGVRQCLKGPDLVVGGRRAGELSLSVVPQAKHRRAAPSGGGPERTRVGARRSGAYDILPTRGNFHREHQYIGPTVQLGGGTYPRFFFKFWTNPTTPPSSSSRRSSEHRTRKAPPGGPDYQEPTRSCLRTSVDP